MAESSPAQTLPIVDAKATVTGKKDKPASGLSQAEVDSRIKQFGYNEITEKKAYPVLNFLSKFWGATAWMLEFIIVLSWFLHNRSDAYVVGGLLVFNAFISSGWSKALQMP
jgi:magnesium-transporting ATPase (P-type)